MFLFLMVCIMGAALGSFASVLIARADNPVRIIWDVDGAAARSSCSSCGRILTYLDLLPILGWLTAKGRCRSCQAPIGLRYVMYEVIGAGAMGVALIVLHFAGALIIFAAFLPILIAIGALLYFQQAVPRVYWGIGSVLLLVFLIVL